MFLSSPPDAKDHADVLPEQVLAGRIMFEQLMLALHTLDANEERRYEALKQALMKNRFAPMKQDTTGPFAAMKQDIQEQFDAMKQDNKEQFAVMKQDMNNGFDDMNKQFDDMNKQFDDMNNRFDDMINGSMS